MINPITFSFLKPFLQRRRNNVLVVYVTWKLNQSKVMNHEVIEIFSLLVMLKLKHE